MKDPVVSDEPYKGKVGRRSCLCLSTTPFISYLPDGFLRDDSDLP
jgi:hypothetical protein